MIPFSMVTSSPNISTELIWLNEKSTLINIDEPDELDETDFWMLINSPGGSTFFRSFEGTVLIIPKIRQVFIGSTIVSEIGLLCSML